MLNNPIMIKLSSFLIGFCCLFLTSCEHDSERDSDDYSTAKERVEALSKEIKVFSEIIDCEFELFNVNGFSDSRVGLPGASFSAYEFVVKIKPEDVTKWIDDDLIKLDSVSYNTPPMTKITKKRSQNWEVTSEPTIYTRKTFGMNEVKIVIYEEGIIYKYIYTD